MLMSGSWVRATLGNVLALSVLGAAPLHAQSTAGETAFVEWASRSLTRLETLSPSGPSDDLMVLRRMIGDARVVALTDFAHMGAEATQFRNRVFTWLVENEGFTVIAVESGLLEGRAAHEYVRGGPGDLDDVVTRSFTYGFHEDPQNAELLRWLRTYNEVATPDKRVDYYGFDVPGRGNYTHGNRFPADQALAFLERVDSAAFGSFHGRLSPLLAHLRAPFSAATYGELTQEQRDALTVAISDLLHRIRQHEPLYAAASSPEEVRWALRAATGAWQMDAELRAGQVQRSAARERAQADNVRWILEQEGPESRILVYASLPHVIATPHRSGVSAESAARFAQLGVEERLPSTMELSAGTYLRDWLGDDLVVIGGLVGNGVELELGCGSGRMLTFPPPPPNTLAGAARRTAGGSAYLLDLRQAPPAVAEWLSQEMKFDDIVPYLVAAPAKAFDVLLYVESVKSACPK